MSGWMMKWVVRVTVAATLAVGAGTGAWAQFNASLSGTVEDPTGAIIPGATVTLVNTGTQAKQTATSTGARDSSSSTSCRRRTTR